MKNESTNPETTNNYPTQAQVEQWKKQHNGGVFLVEVEDKKAWLKAPDRKILAVASLVGKKDPMKFNETILQNCWLAGDEEIKTDDQLFLGAAQVLDEMIQFKHAEIKKL